MRVLGLDPGLASAGFGLVEAVEGSLRACRYGVLRTPARMPTAERLLLLHGQLVELLAEERPEVVAVEKLYFGSNTRTAIVVGEARGVLLLAAAQADQAIAEYTPMEVKQAITGYGGADKVQMQQMVRILLGLEDLPRPDDAADALATAICHHHTARMAALAAAPTGRER